jgi:hypothetical protein
MELTVGIHYSTTILVLQCGPKEVIMIKEAHCPFQNHHLHFWFLVVVLIFKIYIFKCNLVPPNKRKGAHLKFMIKSTSLAQTLFFSVNLVYQTVNCLPVDIVKSL